MTSFKDQPFTGLTPLKEHDPELYDIIEREKNRQWRSLELIASENFTSKAVIDCLGSTLTNKYAEGLPGARYYGGNEEVDKVERLCQSRALEAFRLNPSEWGINVQPYSGSPANFEVYTALLNPHDRIMGLDLPSGGHLTHGFYTYNKKEGTRKAVSATSVYFESLPYRCNEEGFVDLVQLRRDAGLYKPKLIVMGGSAYPRRWDVKAFREIADENGALLMFDMAHIAGLVATEEGENPFEYCDIVTTTTHKTLRGPRAGMIFFRKDERNFETRINQAVFPALQGGPHEHQIAGVATQMKEVMTPEFKQYIQQVRSNASHLADKLVEKGMTIASGGTQNHLLLWDLKPQGVTGSKMEKLCDRCNITLNKNTVQGDRSAITPGGVRIGTCPFTTRKSNEGDWDVIADFLVRALNLCVDIQKTSGSKLKDFVVAIADNAECEKLRRDVNDFCTSFPMPGFETKDMVYQNKYGPYVE